jgi:hypothetical protein
MKNLTVRIALTGAVLALLGLNQTDHPAIARAKSKPGKNAAAARENTIVRSPYYLKASDAYRKGNYRDAIKNFELCDTNGGCCQWTHYYLGLSYQAINQLGPAYQQFQWVLSYGKDANLRRYSQFASDSLSAYAGSRTYGGQGAIDPSNRAGAGSGHGHGRHQI